MARSRKSHKTNEEETKSRRGPPSYPYVVYASWTPPGYDLRWLVLKFKDAWGARNMINALTHSLFGGSYELKTRPGMGWHYMHFDNGMQISLRDNERYSEVMELEFDDTEAFVSDEVQQFKYGSTFESRETSSSDTPSKRRSNRRSSGDRTEDSHTDGTEKKRSRDAGDKVKGDRSGSDAVHKKRPKLDRSGLVSANDIAVELGVEGRIVRGVLRGLKLTKPEGGWAWKPDEAEEIKKKIKAGLK